MLLGIRAIYTDGGIIGRNNSPHGGTYACVFVPEDGPGPFVVSGVITPADVRLPLVENNLTETMAAAFALRLIPPTWDGTLYTDNGNTANRIRHPDKIKMRDVPDDLREWVRESFFRVPLCGVELVKGHCTEAEKAAGAAWSVYNELADRHCCRLSGLAKLKIGLPLRSDEMRAIRLLGGGDSPETTRVVQ